MKGYKRKIAETIVLKGAGFWNGEADGIAVCDRCGGPLMYETKRCPKCHPRIATDREARIIRQGTAYNPNIITPEK